MATIIGGNDTGLLDSSLYLLGRNDNTGTGGAGHGEDAYVNVSNGNLILRHVDSYLPSQGEDFALVRTYNSRGTAEAELSAGWSLAPPILLDQITANEIILRNTDSSEYRYVFDDNLNLYLSVDGAGAHETLEKGSFYIERLSYKNGNYSTTAETLKNAYRLVRADQTVLYFDNTGTLTQSIDPNGNVIQYEYQSNRLSRVLDDQGHVISYEYQGSTLVRVVDNDVGVLVNYEYSQGKLVRVTDRAGHVTTYSYNTDGTLASVTLPTDGDTAARTLRFEYVQSSQDVNGQAPLLSRLIDAEGNETRFSYQWTDSTWSQYQGGSTTMVNALGINRAESNSSDYLAWRQENGYYGEFDDVAYHQGLFETADGSRVFDAARWADYKAQVDEIQANHSVVYSFDANGAITAVAQAKQSAGVVEYDYRTEYQYDDKENLIAVIDANAYAVTHSDDIYFRALRAEAGIIDPLTSAGKLVAELTDAERDALRARYTTHFDYDERGQMLRRIDGEGNITTFTYTNFNKIASETRAMGHALAESDAEFYREKRMELGFAAEWDALSDADKKALRDLYTTHYSYDERQNLIEITAPGGDLTRFEYDAFGNVTKKVVYLDANDLVSPAKQQVTQYFYDAYGNNVKTVEPNAWWVLNSDDPYWLEMRKLLGVVDNDNNGIMEAKLNPKQEAYLLSRFTSTATYDLFGNRLTYTDPNGGLTTYTYDADNRLTSVRNAENELTVFHYDAVGNRIAVTDANGHTVTYVYDKNNRLIATIDPGAHKAEARETTYRYDVVGNRTAVIDAEGRETQYIYREDRRLVEVLSAAVEDRGEHLRYSTRYAYDAVGNRISVWDANGNLTRYVYTPNNLVKETVDPIGNVTQYRYDANLNQVQITIGAQLAPALRRVLSYAFDEENQLIRTVDAEGGETINAYDAVGNLIAVTDANGHTTTFEYDAQNRLIRETGPEVEAPDEGGSVRYSVEHYFDAKGNELATRDANGVMTRVVFDKVDRQVMITDGNGVNTVFRYDSRGNRTEVYLGVQAHVTDGEVVIDGTSDAQVTTYAYDSFNQLVATTSGLGHALVTHDSVLYRELRKALGYVNAAGEGKLAAELTQTERDEILATYTTRYQYDRVGNRTALIDRNQGQMQWTYDALDRLVRTTDATGATTSHRYDGNGNRVATTSAVGHALISSDDAPYRALRSALGFSEYAAGLSATDRDELLSGYTTTYGYDANDRLITTQDPFGVRTTRTYDHVGNLLSETRDADGRAATTHYEYDLNNRLRAVVDPENARISYEYDAVGNRLKVVDGRGHATKYDYDALNRLVKVIDPMTFETRFEYDGVGNRLTVVDTCGGVTRFTFDPGNRQVQVEDAEHRVSQYTYDLRGNRVTEIRGLGTPEARTTHFEYDAENQLRSVEDAEHGVTAYAYDAEGNRTATTDARGNTTHYAFDATNRLITVQDAHERVTSYSYDAEGNRLTITDAEGRVTRFEYDALNRQTVQIDADGVVTRYAYDTLGNRVDIIRADGIAQAQHTRFTYDDNGRLIAMVDAMGNVLAEGDDAAARLARQQLGYPVRLSDLSEAQREALRTRHTITHDYDENGNLIRQTDALGRATEYAYDENNRQISIIDPIGVKLAESDDEAYRAARLALGFAESVSDLSAKDLAGLKAKYTTRYEYDEAGNRTRITDPLGHAQTFYYNLAGEVTHAVDAEGAVTYYDYNAHGEAVVVRRYAHALAMPADPTLKPNLPESADDRVTYHAYDDLGRLFVSVDPGGYVTKYEYDPNGNRTASVAYATAITINPSADLASQLPPPSAADRQTTYVYDELNRLIRSTDGEGVVREYAYDAVGNRTQTRVAGRPVSLTTYDVMNRVETETDALGTITRYGYDAHGNLTHHIVGEGTALARTTLYRYDDNNRLVERLDGAGTLQRHSTRYTYDAAGQLIEQTDGAGTAEARTTVFAYDDAGQQTEAVGAEGALTRYVYDEAGRQTAVIAAAGTDEARTTRYEFDANGRVLRTFREDQIQEELTYDVFGNLVRRTNALGFTTTHYYDLNDRRVLTVDALGGLTAEAYNAFGEVVSTTVYAQSLEGSVDPSERPAPVASDGEDAVTYYDYDRLGRRTARQDAEGYLTIWQYDDFGNLVFSTAFATALSRNEALPLSAQRPEADPAQDRTVWYAYDAVNHRVAALDGEGYYTAHRYDALGQLIETKAYATQIAFDSALPLEGQAPQTHSDDRITTYRYDARGRLTHETRAVNDTHSITTRYTLNGFGERTVVTEAAGSVDERSSRYTYDRLGRVVVEENAEGVLIRYEYNLNGQITDRFDAEGRPEQRHTHFEYDALGRLTAQGNPDGTVTEFAYDSLDRLTARIDASGSDDARKTTYDYDRLNQLTQEVIGAGTPAALVRTYAYDAFGRRIDEVIAPGTTDARATHFDYDRNGRLVARTDGNGITTHFAYTAFGEVKTQRITERLPGADGKRDSQVVTTAYDRRGLALEITDGEDNATLQGYTAFGELSWHDRGVRGTDYSEVARTDYAYDGLGRLTEKVVYPRGEAETTFYVYDDRGNLIAETLGERTTRTEYDFMNRAWRVTDGEGFTTEFAYDAFGNQITIITGLYLGDSDHKAAQALPAVTRFAYDAMNRQTHQVDALGVVTFFDYDARGNRALRVDAYGYLAPVAADAEAARTPVDITAIVALTASGIPGFAATDARTSKYTYDAVDRLIKERQPLGTVIAYTYTAAGERHTKTMDVGGIEATTAWRYDAGGLLGYEIDPTGSVTRFEYDDFGQIIRKTEGLALGANGAPSNTLTADSRVTGYAYDLAGRKTAEIIDPEGLALTTAYEYDRRGNVIAITDPNGHRGESAYDGADRLVWQRDAEGAIVTFHYDARGNKIEEIRYAHMDLGRPYGEAPDLTTADQRTTYAYDLCDRLIERTDARGVVNRLVYDAVGNVTWNIQNATGAFDSPVRASYYVYNAANLVTEQWEHLSLEKTEQGSTLDQQLAFLSAQLAVRGPAAGIKAVIPGVALRTSFEHDAVYNITAKETANTALGAGGTIETKTVRTTYTYDLNNRLIDEIVDPSGLAIHTGYRYDALANRTAEISPNGFEAIAGQNLTEEQRAALLATYTTRTWFDAAGRVRFTVDPLGYVKEVRYDAVGNLINAVQYSKPLDLDTLDGITTTAFEALMEDVGRRSTEDRRVRYEFDKANRQKEIRLDEVQSYVLTDQGYVVQTGAPTTSSVYDGVGNLLAETDANGYTTYHAYDGRGLRTHTLDAEGYLTVFTYDAFGNVTEEALYLNQQAVALGGDGLPDLKNHELDGCDARIIKREYDLAGNEIVTRHPESVLWLNGAERLASVLVARSYDAFGNVIRETVPHAVNVEGTFIPLDADGGVAAHTKPAARHFTYDAAGRLESETDTLGNQTEYTYYASGALREKLEGTRVTTFEYDAAGRNTRVLYPEVKALVLDGMGDVDAALSGDHFRAVGDMEYDATGNLVFERRIDGTEIHYYYDAANRKVAAVDHNRILTTYGYDFAGDRTSVHHYYRPLASIPASLANFTVPEADAKHDQVIVFERDTLGRIVRETQHGGTESDDRTTLFGYDQNGNQVRFVKAAVDGVGFETQVRYDALGRVIGTEGPEGSLTVTEHDALGNVVMRQVGGWNAPELVGQAVSQSLVRSDGMVVQLRTDRATETLIKARKVGTSEWQHTFGYEGAYTQSHAILLSGLEAGTAYEYVIESKDLFGFTLSTEAQTFTTTLAVGPMTVSGLTQGSDGRWTVDVAFALPDGASQPTLWVGEPGLADPLNLGNASAFTATSQGDGSFVASLSLSDPAQQAFQLRYLDSAGQLCATVPELIQQTQRLGVVDASVQSQPSVTPNAYDVLVRWNLPLESVAVDYSANPPEYAAMVGFTPLDGSEAGPEMVNATWEDGQFIAYFTALPDTAGVFEFFYVDPQDNASPTARMSVTGLASLDQSTCSLTLMLEGVEAEGNTLVFEYTLAGTEDWQSLPSAPTGATVELSALPEGRYDYRAVVRNAEGVKVTESTGHFALHESGRVLSLTDGDGREYSVTTDDNWLQVPDLLPLADDERIWLTLTDADGTATAQAFDANGFDLLGLDEGEYTLRFDKEVKETQTTTDEQGNETTTVVWQNVLTLNGTLHIDPLMLASAESTQLSGVRQPMSVRLGSDTSVDIGAIFTGESTSIDHVFSVYDEAGHRVYSNENGGVWTRYFYDGQGNAVREVRFLYQNPIGNFLDEVPVLIQAPDRSFLDAMFVAAETAYAEGRDTLRETTRAYDSEGRLRRETVHTRSGVISSRFQYDRFGNKTIEIVGDTTALGRVADLEDTETDGKQRTDYVYDGMDRVVKTTYGAAQYFTSAGNATVVRPEEITTYDRYGNVSTVVTERSDDSVYTQKRYHHGVGGQLLSEWDARFLDGSLAPTGNSTLRVDYAYDDFGRLETRTATDLRADADNKNKVQKTTFSYTVFDQVAKRTEAETYKPIPLLDLFPIDIPGIEEEQPIVTRMAYDRAGNLESLTDARNNTQRFEYNGDGRLIRKTDALGQVWETTYDAYGNKVSETEPNGRVITYKYGAFGQLLETHRTLTRDVVTLLGDAEKLAEVYANGEEHAFGFRMYDYAALSRYQLRSYTNATAGTTSKERNSYDAWGRLSTVTDPGAWWREFLGLPWRDDLYEYNEADQVEKITRKMREPKEDGATVTQVAEFTYDSQGNRKNETLRQGDEVLRAQTNTYNDRGWLTGVDTVVDGKPVALDYKYDLMGNRVVTGSHHYTYDAENRMISAVEVEWNKDEKRYDSTTVSMVGYDGFGNRIRETTAAGTTTYRYDRLNRLVSGEVAGQETATREVWRYDANGNVLSHTWKEGGKERYTYNTYDAAGRTATSKSKTSDDAETRTWMYYEAAGNLGATRVESDSFGMDEVTYFDVNYNTTKKDIPANASWVSKAKYLYGTSRFTYDANDQLVYLNRGRPRGAQYDAVGMYTYDNEGKIIERADKGAATTPVGAVYGYTHDPSIAPPSEGFWTSDSPKAAKAKSLFNGQATGSATLIGYVYAEGRPVAELRTERTFTLVQLNRSSQVTVTGVYESDQWVATGWHITVSEADLQYAGGVLDAAKTWEALAARAYDGWNSLSTEAQEAAAANLAAQKPITGAGQAVALAPYLLVVNATGASSLRTDYVYEHIGGADGLNPAGVRTHIVQSGDTLQSLAAAYFGASSYWYLIADANGLMGTEALEEGAALTVPNTLAGSINDKDTYKLYVESDIIGTDSAVVQVQQKKKSRFQKLVAVIIVVIIVVVAYWVAAEVAPAIWGAVVGTSTGIAYAVAAAAATLAVAAAGYAIGYATSYITQGLAIAAGLQEEWDWKAMKDMGKSFAVTAVSANLISWANSLDAGWSALAKGTIAAGQQHLRDGKITSTTGILMAMVPAGDKLAGKDGWWVDSLTEIDEHRNTVGAGLAMLEADIRNDESPLGWANFAAAAVGDGIAGNSGGYYDSTGFDWRRVAVETVINAGLAAAVGDKFGEDAALNFFGGAMGQTATGMMGSKAQWEADYQRFSAGMSDEDARTLADLRQLPKAQREALQRQAANNAAPNPNLAGAGAREMHYNPATGRYEDETGRPMPAMVASNGMTADVLPLGAEFAAFETGDGPTATTTGTYTIQSGDTLSVLAQKTGLSVEYLARINGIENPDLIFAGSTLSGFSEDQLALLAGTGAVNAISTDGIRGIETASLTAQEQALIGKMMNSLVSTPQGLDDNVVGALEGYGRFAKSAAEDLWEFGKTIRDSYGYMLTGNEEYRAGYERAGAMGTALANLVVDTAGTYAYLFTEDDDYRQYYDNNAARGERMLEAFDEVKQRYDAALARGDQREASAILSEGYANIAGAVVSVRGVGQIGAVTRRVEGVPNKVLPEGATFEGTLYRSVDQGYDPLLIHSGNVAASHRYTGPGQGGLYLSTGERVVQSELVNNGISLTGKQMHAFPDSSVSGLLDLSNPAVRENLGVNLSDLTRTGGTQAWRYEVTQPLGQWAQQNGYRGIVAPSAQADGGLNVILFDSKVLK